MYKPRLTMSALSLLGASFCAIAGIPLHLLDSKFNGRGTPARKKRTRSNRWRNWQGATYHSVQFTDNGFARVSR